MDDFMVIDDGRADRVFEKYSDNQTTAEMRTSCISAEVWRAMVDDCITDYCTTLFRAAG
jgi:hypothetical protein